MLRISTRRLAAGNTCTVISRVCSLKPACAVTVTTAMPTGVSKGTAKYPIPANGFWGKTAKGLFWPQPAIVTFTSGFAVSASNFNACPGSMLAWEILISWISASSALLPPGRRQPMIIRQVIPAANCRIFLCNSRPPSPPRSPVQHQFKMHDSVHIEIIPI